jgi:hypothetical protein
MRPITRGDHAQPIDTSRSAMFSRSIRKTVQPHLHPAEQLLAAVLAQNAGANAAMMVSALRGPVATAKALDAAEGRHADARAAAEPAGIQLDRRMVIAVTTERLLVFRSGGAFTVKAKQLLAEVPMAAIDAIDVERDGHLTEAVTLRVRGTAIVLETARGQRPEDLSRALESARPRASASPA